MMNRNSQEIHEIVWLLIGICVMGIWCMSCATTSCRPPEARAAERGAVLECRTIQKNGKSYRSCLVLVPGGNTANFAYKACPS